MSLFETIANGLAGSFAAGLVTLVLFDANGDGIPLSVAFASLIVYLSRRSRGGSLTKPYAGYRRRAPFGDRR
jgi:hypothetical protein